MPLPKKLTRTIEKFAKRDSKISKKFYPYLEKKGDLPLYILSQHGQDGIQYFIIGVVQKWGVEFNEYRDRTVFSVSTNRTDFGGNGNETFFEIIKRASHVAKNGEIYSLNNGDTVQAFQFGFAYNFLAELEAQKTFDLTKAENEPAD